MKKKKKINDENEGPAWLTTFNDLVTLLMVFFVLIFTMSSLDIKKLKEVKSSLQSGLGVLKEGQKVSIKVIAPQSPSDVGSLTLDEKIEEEMPDKVEEMPDKVEEMPDKVEEMPNKFQDFLKIFDFDPDIAATYTEKGLLITLSSTVIFQFGEADINPESFPILDKIAAAISKMSEFVRVEGHTDNVPVVYSKRFPSNWELSIKRAVNVVKYFVQVREISPQRLSAVGYGESKPLFANDTPEHRARNRRVEILLVTGGKD